MDSEAALVKRGRGRPKKESKGRGRPPLDPEANAKRKELKMIMEKNKPKRGLGRPPYDAEKEAAKWAKIDARMAKIRELRTWKKARENPKKIAAKNNPGTLKKRGRPPKNPPREEEENEEEEDEEDEDEDEEEQQSNGHGRPQTAVTLVAGGGGTIRIV